MARARDRGDGRLEVVEDLRRMVRDYSPLCEEFARELVRYAVQADELEAAVLAEQEQ